MCALINRNGPLHCAATRRNISHSDSRSHHGCVREQREQREQREPVASLNRPTDRQLQIVGIAASTPLQKQTDGPRTLDGGRREGGWDCTDCTGPEMGYRIAGDRDVEAKAK